MKKESRLWTPPFSSVDACRKSAIKYVDAPMFRDLPAHLVAPTGRVMLEPTKRLLALRTEIMGLFPVTQTWMRRAFAIGDRPDTTRLDMHSAGRAIDFMCFTDFSLGEKVADYCLEHHERLGVQFVVFAGMRFSAGQRGVTRFAKYTGKNPHYDHPHVEVVP